MRAEPSETTTVDDAPASTRCLNCGALTGPRFCGACGQAVDDRRSPFLSLVRELVEEWFAIDGRLIRTLRALPRPGQLTRLYLSGKRAPFLAPFRLYLLASVALFSSVLTLRPPDAGDINFYIGGVLIGHEHVRGRPTITIESPDFGLPNVTTPGVGELDARLRARPPQEVLDRLFNGIRETLPISLILFVPLVALVLKALYFRSHVLYVDHLIFAAHFQSALFLVLAACWLILRLVDAGFLVAILTYVPVAFLMLTIYLPWALRRIYEQSRWMTAAKTVMLLFAYAILLREAVGIPIVATLVSI